MSAARMSAVDPSAASRFAAEARERGRTLGFVPTMGALHDGHLSLVRRAARDNDLVCVSIFVNPLQFDNAGDLESYPRDLEADVAKLDAVGCDLVFTGTLASFFPDAHTIDDIPLRDAGPGAVGLEGEHRRGHFAGVATIVGRLFELVRPTAAYFGEKDFQQTLVVRAVAADAGGTRVVVCPTAREADGLAMSSRNARLDPAARRRATCIWKALNAAREAWRAGERDAHVLTAALRAPLDVEGVAVEYAELRDSESWTGAAPTGRLERARALVAANLALAAGDSVRLIDNLSLDEEVPA